MATVNAAERTKEIIIVFVPNERTKMETINRIEEIRRDAEEIVEIAEGSDKNFTWVLGDGVRIAVESGNYSTYEIGVLIQQVGKTYVAVSEWRASQGMKKV